MVFYLLNYNKYQRKQIGLESVQDKVHCIWYEEHQTDFDSKVAQVSIVKLLGVTIDERLTWSDHIDGIVVKTGQSIAVACRFSPYITPSIRKEVTLALVLSHLEYCMVVWSSASKMDIKNFN